MTEQTTNTTTDTTTELKFILVEWIDKNDLYHNGVYSIKDKKEIEIKLNDWLTSNYIKSYDINLYEGII